MKKSTLKLYSDKKQLRKFMYYLINDIKALEHMLAADMFEKDVQRIGAEQELCLLDKYWRPAPMAMQILDEIEDEHFTTEHSQYNLEINLDPLEFTGHCLSEMERRLQDYLSSLEKVVERYEGTAILVGILPTIRRIDLELKNLTPLPRYRLLNEVMNKLRGGPYEFRIEGIDELITRHNSIMFEGCNTSFQIHFQVNPDTFANTYNWAQAISAPVLAAATNSPMLLGKRLWEETRIALFQQSVDTRRSSYYSLREKSSRITFGNKWVEKSITEIFKEDITRYQVLIAKETKEDSINALDEGLLPALKALQIHNSTVYRWNRGCYGITNGKPHIRIENRTLPAGPTVVDEIANSAFWLGLMNNIPDEYNDIANLMDFDEVRLNFLKAARSGLETQFKWIGGKVITPEELILKELHPIAKNGLEKAGIAKDDINHYLGIIEKRVKTRKTGSKWMLGSFAELRKQRAKYEASVAITAGIVNRQKSGKPVHEWTPADINEAGDWINRYWTVEQIMYADLFTVHKDDLIHYVANIMSWQHLRYIPVEDDKGKLVGLLTSRALLDYYSANMKSDDKLASVKDIMIRNPKTVSSETLSIDALIIMRESKIGCLPVVKNDKLVGIVTELNFMNLSEYSIQKLVQESKDHNYG